MFEQSILANVSAASKTRALAASFGIQTMVIVAVLAVPLLFADRLPRIPLWTPLAAPLPAPPPPAPVDTKTSSSSAPSMLRAMPRPFPAIATTNRPVSYAPTIISDASPSGDSFVPQIGVIGGLGTATAGIPIVVAAPHVNSVIPVKKSDKPQRVGGDVQAAKLIRKIVPQYPEIAKRARISGTVQLTGVIAKNGTIEQLELISGNPLLVPAAIAAVKQWIYSPTFLNGEPVEVIAPIDVIFRLSQ